MLMACQRRYNDNPHGLFGIVSDNQQVAVDPVDLSRSLALNFSRYDGTFGSVILTYNVVYDQVYFFSLILRSSIVCDRF